MGRVSRVLCVYRRVSCSQRRRRALGVGNTTGREEQRIPRVPPGEWPSCCCAHWPPNLHLFLHRATISSTTFHQVKRNDSGSIEVLARSCTHPRAPPLESRVRATTVYSGYTFQPVTVEGQAATLITGLVKQDLGGYIPGFMLSQLNRKVIAEWMHTFIASCIRCYPQRDYS